MRSRANGCAASTRTARCGRTRSRGCTTCSCERPASRSRAAGPRCRTCAANDSTTSPLRAADDALVAVLAKLDDYRGESRFTTWAYKFALLEAAVQAAPARLAGPRGPARAGDVGAVCRASGLDARPGAGARASCWRRCSRAIDEELTPHQREVLVALALNGVPIDVLAERLGHDPRRPLQDAARRAPQAAQPPGRAGAGHWERVPSLTE